MDHPLPCDTSPDALPNAVSDRPPGPTSDRTSDRTSSPPPLALSVVIPVYREQARIQALLAHLAALPVPGGLRSLPTEQPTTNTLPVAEGVATGAVATEAAKLRLAEILVVDGDPQQRTLAAMAGGQVIGENTAMQEDPDLPAGQASAKHTARPCGAASAPPAQVWGLAAAKGRARQMNAGAAAAQGSVLLFLHADTSLPPEALDLIQKSLADPDICGGAFALRIVPSGGLPGPGLRCIARAANLRSKLTRAPYGDQAIFLRQDCFQALGGFADIPLMEDLEFMTRLRRSGRKIRLLDAGAATSARRWEAEGLLRCTGRNLLLRALYHLGVSPRRLARFYK